MKMIKSLMLVAAAAMAFTGCSKEEGASNDMGVKVRFTTTTDQTRTAFGEPDGTTYPTLWQENDQIALRLNAASSTPPTFTVTPINGGANATFEATLEDDYSGSYTIQALSPASAYFSIGGGNFRVTVPATQTPAANSCDPAAQILFAASETTTTMPTSITLHFSHATAYGKFSLQNLALGDAKVQSVSLTAESAITGQFEYDFSTKALSERSTGNTLTINTTETENLWFACAPADLSGTKLKIAVTTDEGTLTKEITMGENRALEAGKIALFTVDMSGIEPASEKYQKVTDAADLQEGDQVIIAANDYDYAISTNQKTNNRDVASVTKEDDGMYIVNPTDAVQIFELEAVNTSEYSGFAFKTPEGSYIYAASSSSNYLRTGTLNANSTWSISIEEGVATITAKGSYTHNIIQYNPGSSTVSPVFSCYASTQKAVAIYKKVE